MAEKVKGKGEMLAESIFPISLYAFNCPLSAVRKPACV